MESRFSAGVAILVGGDFAPTTRLYHGGLAAMVQASRRSIFPPRLNTALVRRKVWLKPDSETGPLLDRQYRVLRVTVHAELRHIQPFQLYLRSYPYSLDLIDHGKHHVSGTKRPQRA